MANELESDSEKRLPIRPNLVDTAVSFLMNNNVKQRPDDAKIAFLKKKGLTEPEIVEAFNRVKYAVEATFTSHQDEQLVNAYPLPPYQRINPFWFYLRSYSSVFVSFSVAIYVLHRFYKLYIEPWLFGPKPEKGELYDLKQQVAELNSSVSQLTSTVASLEEAINNQMRLDKTSLYGVESVPKSVSKILDEVSNVKGLLLNRFSFPAPPSIAGNIPDSKTQNGDTKVLPKKVSIPKWQMRDSEKESGDDTKTPSSPTSSENGWCSVESEKNSPDKAEGSNTAVEDTKEPSLVTKGETQNEVSEIAVEYQARNREDSDVESHNQLSDSDSTSVNNVPDESTKNSE